MNNGVFGTVLGGTLGVGGFMPKSQLEAARNRATKFLMRPTYGMSDPNLAMPQSHHDLIFDEQETEEIPKHEMKVIGSKTTEEESE